MPINNFFGSKLLSKPVRNFVCLFVSWVSHTYEYVARWQVSLLAEFPDVTIQRVNKGLDG